MKFSTDLTPEQVRAWVEARKLQAFDYCRTLQRIEPKHLGYPSHAEAALGTINTAMDEINKNLLCWEKANPR